jgi:hypothetical protein
MVGEVSKLYMIILIALLGAFPFPHSIAVPEDPRPSLSKPWPWFDDVKYCPYNNIKTMSR